MDRKRDEWKKHCQHFLWQKWRRTDKESMKERKEERKREREKEKKNNEARGGSTKRIAKEKERRKR